MGGARNRTRTVGAGDIRGPVVIVSGGLHDRLVGHLDEMRRLGAVHRGLCSAAEPDPAAIGTTRWRMAGAGRIRMDLLLRSVFPLLEGRCQGAELAAVSALRFGTTGYRNQVSVYLSRWSTATILEDWSVYRDEADRFRTMVASRLAVERRLLVPLLRRVACDRAVTQGEGREGPSGWRDPEPELRSP